MTVSPKIDILLFPKKPKSNSKFDDDLKWIQTVSSVLEIKETSLVENCVPGNKMKKIEKALLSAFPNFDGSETTDLTIAYVDECNDLSQSVIINDLGTKSFFL
jgi:hypothetical protein